MSEGGEWDIERQGKKESVRKERVWERANERRGRVRDEEREESESQRDWKKGENEWMRKGDSKKTREGKEIEN